jgi:tetraacyldisaccharide 4'-kinase
MNLESLWYSNKNFFSLALAPLAWLFCLVVKIRQQAYKRQWISSKKFDIPIIIVGNITIGGTGKTPLVIWLAKFLKTQGLNPGIISRGYGGSTKSSPQAVYPDSDPQLVGDEPVLIARHSGCPVAVAPKRSLAVEYLLSEYNCNIIISDDGLQHYALQRDIEIAVVDAQRRYGNERCLPAGPLREPLSRLKTVDWVISKGIELEYEIKELRRVSDDQIVTAVANQKVHAIAAIGNPNGFFQLLRQYGLELDCHEFRDHHIYTESDILFDDDLPVIMTEKDAVKCKSFAKQQHWYLLITAKLPESFKAQINKKLTCMIIA